MRWALAAAVTGGLVRSLAETLAESLAASATGGGFVASPAAAVTCVSLALALDAATANSPLAAEHLLVENLVAPLVPHLVAGLGLVGDPAAAAVPNARTGVAGARRVSPCRNARTAGQSRARLEIPCGRGVATDEVMKDDVIPPTSACDAEWLAEEKGKRHLHVSLSVGSIARVSNGAGDRFVCAVVTIVSLPYRPSFTS